MFTPNTLIIDGNNLFARAFYSVQYHTHNPTPLDSVQRFLEMWSIIHSTFATTDPAYYFVFDGGSNVRRKLYPAYKAQRTSCPPEYISQLQVVMFILAGMGIPTIRIPGWEADDIMATLAGMSQNYPSLIVTRDKDMFQLVNEHIHVYDSQDNIIFNTEEVEKKFGVSPCAFRMYLAIKGDSSDNIPGIKGYGSVRAKYIASNYPTPSELFSKLDEDGLVDLDGPSYLWALHDKRDEVLLSYNLVGLHDVSAVHEIPPGHLRNPPVDSICKCIQPLHITVYQSNTGYQLSIGKIA